MIGSKRARRMLAGAGVVGALALAGAWVFGVEPSEVKEFWRSLELWLMDHPGCLLLALVLLPGFPVPSSALLVAAGVVWRERPLSACLGCVLAILLNMTWTYGLAAGPGRRWVAKLLANTTRRLPELPQADQARLILILRLTPGLPLFFQNYVLGFLRPPFGLYLALSLACNAPIVCGLVLSGAGLASGRLLPLLAGVAVVVLAVVLTFAARRWLARRREPAG